MITFDIILNTNCVPYIFRKFMFERNYDHDTQLRNIPPLDDTPLCDTSDDVIVRSKVT